MNRKEYKEIFNEFHPSEELTERMKNMETIKRNMIKTNRTLRIAVASFAAAVGLFAASNGISIAATGESWISKVNFVNLHGDKLVSEDIKWDRDAENGSYSATIKKAQDDGSDISYVYHWDGETSSDISDAEYGSSICCFESDELLYAEKKHGRVILHAGDTEIDITESIKKNGSAEGTVIDPSFRDGKECRYYVNKMENGKYYAAIESGVIAVENDEDTGKIYVTAGDLKIDITDDFDGTYATGVIEDESFRDGKPTDYTVVKSGDLFFIFDDTIDPENFVIPVISE